LQEIYTEDKYPGDNPRELFFNKLSPVAYVIVVLAIIFLLYQLIGSGVAFLAAGGDTENKAIMRMVLSAAQYIFILLPAVIFTRLQKADLNTAFRLKLPKPVLLFLSVSGIILIQPFIQGYINLQDYLINNITPLRDILKPLKEIFDLLEQSTLKIVKAYSLYEFIIVVFVICITPAICEEILFRGFVLYNLGRVMKASISILISGLLFSVYHFQPFNIIPLMILGSYLGFIVYFSGSIWTGVVCHFLNNFMATYFLYASGKDRFEVPALSSDNLVAVFVTTTVSLLIFIALVYLYYRMRDVTEV
jgi:membrane protease YdiL (CAAX protease family)